MSTGKLSLLLYLLFLCNHTLTVARMFMLWVSLVKVILDVLFQRDFI